MNREYKFPEVMYNLLEKHNMTQRELAELSYCTLNSVYRWLKRKQYPNLYTLMRISEVVNVSIDYLVYGEEKKYKQKSGDYATIKIDVER